MILKTEIEVNGITVEIEALHVPAERGCRDSFGCPIEPDIDPYFELLSHDFDELAEMLDCSVNYLRHVVTDALQNEYIYQYETYLQL